MADRFIYSPETIIKAYSLGVFPMASAHDADEIYFYEPDMRGILPLSPPGTQYVVPASWSLKPGTPRVTKPRPLSSYKFSRSFVFQVSRNCGSNLALYVRKALPASGAGD